MAVSLKKEVSGTGEKAGGGLLPSEDNLCGSRGHQEEAAGRWGRGAVVPGQTEEGSVLAAVASSLCTLEPVKKWS